MNEVSFLAVNVGNSRCQVGAVIDGEVRRQERVASDDPAATTHVVLDTYAGELAARRAPIVIASVKPAFSERLRSALRDQLKADVYMIGEDLPIPIGTQLDPETITGVDRLLNATAAYATLKQACIVVDAGTAVTIDFVDGEGTFHGGAIAPGAGMQLRSLHEGTAALPEVRFAAPEGDAFGRSTSQAMLQGVFHGLRGLVWKLVERYAEAYGAFPQVIATGGDAELLFRDDELINSIVPDLTLRGMAETVRSALNASAEDHGNDDLEVRGR
jgi:type III pantothenate kinase